MNESLDAYWYMHYIYILRCPDTNDVRYVGCTQYPKIRERNHCLHTINEPKTRVQAWLKTLREQGKPPVFEIVESGYGSWKHEAEWIAVFNEWGCDLLNVKQNDRNPEPS